jgi:phospholipase D-like protein
MLAYTYPILSFIWMMFVFFFMLSVFAAVIWAFIDNFRRPDHSGWAKAGWALVILCLPLLGTLIYLIARPAVVEVGTV